jgi:hypothetical protein
MATVFEVLDPDQVTGEKAALRVEGLQVAGYFTVIDSACVTKSKDLDTKVHEGLHPICSSRANASKRFKRNSIKPRRRLAGTLLTFVRSEPR